MAKTAYRGATRVLPVLRGTSRVPLCVGAVGMNVEEAAERVRAMHDEHRIPTLLKRLDRLAREG